MFRAPPAPAAARLLVDAKNGPRDRPSPSTGDRKPIGRQMAGISGFLSLPLATVGRRKHGSANTQQTPATHTSERTHRSKRNPQDGTVDGH